MHYMRNLTSTNRRDNSTHVNCTKAALTAGGIENQVK